MVIGEPNAKSLGSSSVPLWFFPGAQPAVWGSAEGSVVPGRLLAVLHQPREQNLPAARRRRVSLTEHEKKKKYIYILF